MYGSAKPAHGPGWTHTDKTNKINTRVNRLDTDAAFLNHMSHVASDLWKETSKIANAAML